jgi:hypothetical protein
VCIHSLGHTSSTRWENLPLPISVQVCLSGEPYQITGATNPSVQAASRQFMSCMLITVVFKMKTFDAYHMVLPSYLVLGNGRCRSTVARHSCSRQQILNWIIQSHSLLFALLNVEVTRAHGFVEGGSSTNLGSLKT